MKYIVFSKWNLYCIYKRRFLNISYVRRFNPTIMKCIWWLLLVVKVVLSYIGVSLIFELSGIDLLSLKDFDIASIVRNKDIMAAVLMIYVAVTSAVVSFQAGNYVMTDGEELWLGANFGLDHKKMSLIKLFNFVSYSSMELITFLLPATIALYVKWQCFDVWRCVDVILIIFVIYELRLLLGLICCLYKTCINSSNKVLERSVVFIRNGIMFFTALHLGKAFSEWFNRFPIVKNRVDGEIVEKWFDEGLGIIKSLFINGEYGLEDREVYYLGGIAFGVIGLQVLIAVSILLFLKVNVNRSGLYKKSGLPSGILQRKLFSKAILSDSNTLYGIDYSVKSAAYWFAIGAYTGIMRYITNAKSLYFVAASCAIYGSLFLATSHYEKNAGIFLLDGEGKKICYWVENIPRLFFEKFKLWCISILYMTVVQYTVMIFLLGRFNLIWFLLLQVVYMSVLFMVYSIPSVLFPYFEYKNINELKEYGERKKVNEAIEPILLLVVNSIVVIPTSLFITGNILQGAYIVLQFVAIPIILIVAAIIGGSSICKVLSGTEYINKIYRKE